MNAFGLVVILLGVLVFWVGLKGNWGQVFSSVKGGL